MKGMRIAAFALLAGVCISAALGATVIPVRWTVTTFPPATATVGDTVTFTWTGTHDLKVFTGDVSCADDDNGGTMLVPVSSGGTGSYTFSAPGTYTFICTVGRHCENGQRVVYTVTAAS